MMRARAGLVLALVGMGGCFASKSDVALIQGQLQGIRDQQVQLDAAQRTHIDQLLSQIQRNNDSVRALSARMARFQSDVQTANYEMGRQLLAMQELTGQSQKRISELRASLEERNQSAGAPGDSTRAAAGAPGPAQLFQSSLDQFRRGSTQVARSGFEDLIRLYPAYEDAPEALVYVGDTYSTEGNQAAADSVYGLVVQKYPQSPKAATALYKHALSLRAAGKSTAARATLNQIIKQYPHSDEAILAADVLKTLR